MQETCFCQLDSSVEGAMARRSKKQQSKKEEVQAIAKNNPQVDEKTVLQSLELIGYLRRMGIQPKGFNLLRSSESKLKLKAPAIYRLKSS